MSVEYQLYVEAPGYADGLFAIISQNASVIADGDDGLSAPGIDSIDLFECSSNMIRSLNEIYDFTPRYGVVFLAGDDDRETDGSLLDISTDILKKLQCRGVLLFNHERVLLRRGEGDLAILRGAFDSQALNRVRIPYSLEVLASPAME